jgi:hydroxymethylpyrimidine/phosphomethylpyrimidine kinase
MPSGDPPPPVPRLLSIAGSDSGGGAGIQADLKAFARCGAHGMTAVTAITAQNTTGVTAVHPVPADVIIAQVAAVAQDVGVDAVKVGMLGDEATIEAVAQAIESLPNEIPVVLDPVMVAESGAPLLEPDAVAALRERLLPRVTAVTPNVAEARALADDQDAEPEELARRVYALGPAFVVVTGGHRDEPVDVFFDGEELATIGGERFPDGASHGSGCTHSAALAAHLARGLAPLEAARAAKEVAAAAVRDGLRDLGAGSGPVDALGLNAGASGPDAPERSEAAPPLT